MTNELIVLVQYQNNHVQSIIVNTYARHDLMTQAFIDDASIGELLLAVEKKLDSQLLRNYIPDECVLVIYG